MKQMDIFEAIHGKKLQVGDAVHEYIWRGLFCFYALVHGRRICEGGISNVRWWSNQCWLERPRYTPKDAVLELNAWIGK